MSSAPKQDASTVPDLSVCEREPIHIPGAIEPNGALLVLKEPELTIVQTSANVGRLLGLEAEALLGTALSSRPAFHVCSRASLLRTSTESGGIGPAYDSAR
jgi:light-regulated signal transduction histidine kinase (bacteriophytochrome)